MAEQQELWAAPARPQSLSIRVERLWTLGDDVWELTMHSSPSKGSNGDWTSHQVLEGPGVGSVTTAVVAAQLSRWGCASWASPQREMPYEWWERHLFDY